MSDGEEIRKQETTEQVDREIDQREVDNSANAKPHEMRIDAAKLFTQATEQTRMALCVSDPFAPDEPIVYVNEAFVDLTGYAREDSIGSNCRFLQGEDTDPAAVAKIRAALEAREVKVVDILNYRKDGTAFWNALHVGPIFDEDGELAYFYGSQWDITEMLTEREMRMRHEQVAKELQHRTGNLFAVIQAIVSLTARGETDSGVLAEKIGQRLQALAVAHRTSIAATDQNGKPADLQTLTTGILKPYQSADMKRITFAGDTVVLPSSTITPLGLALHELATNAVKYGALSVEQGHVCIDWTLKEDELTIRWIESDGPEVSRPAATAKPIGSGMGKKIMDGILRGEGGRIETSFDNGGLTATIHLPLVKDGSTAN